MTFKEQQAEMNAKVNGKYEEKQRELKFTNLGDLNDVVAYKNSVLNLLNRYYYNDFDTLQIHKLECNLTFRDFEDLILARINRIVMYHKNLLSH